MTDWKNHGLRIVRAGELGSVSRPEGMVWWIDKQDLAEFDSVLSQLLRRELENGNSVSQTWRGWPEKRSICVMLRRPFMEDTRRSADADYTAVNDPHYWAEELFRRATGHLLCARLA